MHPPLGGRVPARVLPLPTTVLGFLMHSRKILMAWKLLVYELGTLYVEAPSGVVDEVGTAVLSRGVGLWKRKRYCCSHTCSTKN